MKLKTKPRTPRRSRPILCIDGKLFTREQIVKMIKILTELSETNDYELPYMIPPLIERSLVLIKGKRR